MEYKVKSSEKLSKFTLDAMISVDFSFVEDGNRFDLNEYLILSDFLSAQYIMILVNYDGNVVCCIILIAHI